MFESLILSDNLISLNSLRITKSKKKPVHYANFKLRSKMKRKKTYTNEKDEAKY